MNDVLVSYWSGTFGDWLRYFIAEHDGFAKFTGVTTKIIKGRNDPEYPNFSFHCNKILELEPEDTVEELKSQLRKREEISGKERQVYKSFLRQIHEPKGKTHSLLWNPENYYNDHYDLRYYNIIRETDIRIVFVNLNPLSELFDSFVRRKIDHTPNNIMSEEELRDSFYRSYIHNKYPKHKYNHVVEINELAEYNQAEYLNLCYFLDMKPLDNWKYYIEQLEKVKDPSKHE